MSETLYLREHEQHPVRAFLAGFELRRHRFEQRILGIDKTLQVEQIIHDRLQIVAGKCCKRRSRRALTERQTCPFETRLRTICRFLLSWRPCKTSSKFRICRRATRPASRRSKIFRSISVAARFSRSSDQTAPVKPR